MQDKKLTQEIIAKRIVSASCTPANDLWNYVQSNRIAKAIAESVWSERNQGETLEQGVRWENEFVHYNDI